MVRYKLLFQNTVRVVVASINMPTHKLCQYNSRWIVNSRFIAMHIYVPWLNDCVQAPDDKYN